VVAGEGVVAWAVAVDPGGSALVQSRAIRLGERAVRRVAEEDVVEAVAVVARCGAVGGMDETAPREL
jgi:hypothetical protein